MSLWIITLLPFLLFGAYYDIRERIIPNVVPVGLIFAGILELVISYKLDFLYISLSQRALGLAVPFTALFLIYLHDSKLVGGGDAKLYAALGFAAGINTFLVVMFIACITGLVYSVIRKEQYIPMGVHSFIGAAVLSLLLIIGEGITG